MLIAGFANQKTSADYSNRIAQGSMEAAETIATTSIRAADAGLGAAGVEDGHLWQLGGGALLGKDAAEAVSQIASMVLRFTEDIDLDVLQLQRGIRTLALLQSAAPLPLTPAHAHGITYDGPSTALYMRVAAAAYSSSALRDDYVTSAGIFAPPGLYRIHANLNCFMG